MYIFQNINPEVKSSKSAASYPARYWWAWLVHWVENLDVFIANASQIFTPNQTYVYHSRLYVIELCNDDYVRYTP